MAGLQSQANVDGLNDDDHQDETDLPPSYYEVITGLKVVNFGDSKLFAPLTEPDIRRIIAKNKRLANIEIVSIRNFISFHVRDP